MRIKITGRGAIIFMDIGKQQPHQHRQTIINLHNSGILPDLIATQLDISKDEKKRIKPMKSIENTKPSNVLQMLLR